MKSTVQALTLGFTIVVSILAPTLTGLALDHVCGISPWGVIGGVVCGALCAFGALWQLTKTK